MQMQMLGSNHQNELWDPGGEAGRRTRGVEGDCNPIRRTTSTGWITQLDKEVGSDKNIYIWANTKLKQGKLSQGMCGIPLSFLISFSFSDTLGFLILSLMSPPSFHYVADFLWEIFFF